MCLNIRWLQKGDSLFPVGYLEKKVRKFRKCNITLIKYYTATNTKAFTGTWREKEQC
jgi:hypothetical protein